MSSSFDTPIVLICFNRPEKTLKVLEAISSIMPSRLFVIMDGPRVDRPLEGRLCDSVASLFENISWPCELKVNRSRENLGIRKRISSGLDWVFSEVEQAIILEDDCLAEPSFFYFCSELLLYYRDDARIMHINGTNFQPLMRQQNSGYYFSDYVQVWGWATWRRAWKYYDVEMGLWPFASKERSLEGRFHWSGAVARQWRNLFQLTYDKKINTWDYQWAFACWMQNGIAITPNKNLVSNIGFDAQATHTKKPDGRGEAATSKLELPLRHPGFISIDYKKDLYTQRYIYPSHTLLSKSCKRLVRLFKELLR